jgi:hypothetical protein
MKTKGRSWWRLALGLIGLALGGAAWAAFFWGGCGSCSGSSAGAAGHLLALSGVVYYVLLLGAGLVLGPSRVFWVGVLVAASIHGALLVALVMRGTLCPACILTGAAAIGAAALSCLIEPYNLVRASVILPAAALVTQLGGWALGTLPSAKPARTAAVPVAVPHDESGTVRMVIYGRVDCVFCQRLAAEVLPELAREFGERLRVEHRSAEDLPGLPTPTIILTGAGGRRSFPGLPRTDALRRAILDTLGDSHDRQAMLPASR